jgi:hypothetical protein
LAFVRDVFDLARGFHYSAGTRADELVFITLAVAVSAVSLFAVVRYRRTTPQDPKVIIYLACLAYCLLVPRLKSYSYILLLIPTLQLFRMLPRRVLVPAAVAALAAMVVFPHGNSLLPFHSLAELFYEYLPLAAAFGVWLGYLVVVLGHESDVQPEPATV